MRGSVNQIGQELARQTQFSNVKMVFFLGCPDGQAHAKRCNLHRTTTH